MPDSQLTPEARLELRRRLVPWVLGFAVLIAISALVGYYISESAAQREEDRITSRYVLCRELESVKRSQRRSLTEEIIDAETFIRQNPVGIPGISAHQIQRSITRKRNERRDLAPYPRGCVAFARDPTALNVHVPELREE